MKKILFYLGLAIPCFASAYDISIQTRYGIISVSEDYKLMFNRKHLVAPNEDELDEFLPNNRTIYKTTSGDVILLSANTHPNCVQFRFLSLNNNEQKFSPIFGTCDYAPKISQSGDSIILQMKTQMTGKKKVQVTFTFSDGIVRQKEKIPFWPDGYVEH